MDPTPDYRQVSVHELAEHLQAIATADDDDRADLLCDIIERCWNEMSLRQ